MRGRRSLPRVSERLAQSVALALGIALASCGSTPTSRPLGEPVIVGVTLGLSNAFVTLSPPLRNSIKLAEFQVNSAGGVLGRPIEYRILDDLSEKQGAADRVRELVDQGAVAIIGPLGSGQVTPAYENVAAKNIALISPTATSALLAGLKPSFFRTTPDDTFQARAVARLGRTGPPPGGGADAGAGYACQRMHIMYGDNDYGREMAKAIGALYTKELQPAPTLTAVADLPKNDYDADVAAAVFDNPSQPQCLVLILYEDTGAPVMLSYDKLRKVRPTTVQFIVATDGLYTSGFLQDTRLDRQNVASSVAEGVFGTNPDTAPMTLEYNDFLTLYRAYFGSEPGPFSANAYDAAVLVALAIAQAGSTKPELIRDALRTVSAGGRPFGPSKVGDALRGLTPRKKSDPKEDVDYKGASGDVDFAAEGPDVRGGFITWRVQGGKFETVDRVGADKL